MKHKQFAAAISLGLALASAPGYAFLDNIFNAKAADAPAATDTDGPQPATSASAEANKMADKALYKPIEYVNASFPGPVLVVLPGDIKSSNATFTQKIGSNNIADFAELELTRANFKVLERSDLGPLLKEVQLAYGMGDAQEAAKLFKRGKFKTTKWLVKFDVLKAEPVAQAQKGFDGAAVGQLAGLFVPGMGGAAASVVGGSVKTAESAGIWIVGLRYKILDANTTEQVAACYVEDKMEIGAKSTSVMGVSEGASGGFTLDTLVQRLVQSSVAEMDTRYKKSGASEPVEAQREETPPEAKPAKKKPASKK